MREFFIRTQNIRWISFTILISVFVIVKQQDVGYILFSAEEPIELPKTIFGLYIT